MKKAPHWMNCNCLCHGDWGEVDHSTIAKDCPHCNPKMFPGYEVEEEEV